MLVQFVYLLNLKAFSVPNILIIWFHWPLYLTLCHNMVIDNDTAVIIKINLIIDNWDDCHEHQALGLDFS